MTEFAIYECSHARKRQVGEAHPTFDAAKAFAETNFAIMYIEDDADNPECADFITTHGLIFAIERKDAR